MMMDSAELLDDMERFETESALAELALEIARSLDGQPMDPATDETLFVRFGAQQVDVAAIILKMSRDDREAVFS